MASRVPGSPADDVTGESSVLRGRGRKDELSALHRDADSLTRTEFAFQDLLRERIFDALLDGALQGPRTVYRVVTRFAQVVARGIVEHEVDVALGEALSQVSQLDINDRTDLIRAERVEHDDVVEPVDEFWPEILLHDFEHGRLHLRIIVLARHFLDQLRTEIGRQDNDRVAKVDGDPGN